MEIGPRISSDSIVDLTFSLKWRSGHTIHTDVYQADGVNIWRDFLPPVILNALMGRQGGLSIPVPLEEGVIIDELTGQNLFDVRSAQFDRRFRQGMVTEPRLGRFYPKGMLKGVAGIFKANMQPFRCVGLKDDHLTVNFNHPLAGYDLQCSVTIGKIRHKPIERGGTRRDWLNVLTSGPGMQARWKDQQTDYFSDDPFSRADEQPDPAFYQKPRIVNHIDDTARQAVRNTYAHLLSDGMQVLDIMSSWDAHISDDLQLNRLVGLGLNRDELQKNTRLSEWVVHDLNADPALPFPADSFDAVVNTVSIEYLTDPFAVFREVIRILRPGGWFIVAFSNRWFPTKAIRMWAELHEFERMGLVLELFLRSGGFKELQTYSIRGMPRPLDDRYFPEAPFSDPIYAVWGRTR